MSVMSWICKNCGHVNEDEYMNYCEKCHADRYAGGEHDFTEEETTGCFIATAAYGTPLADEINILRNWRDNSLIKTKMGRGLVSMYYTISPPIAKYITKSDKRRRITSGILRPLINFLKISKKNNISN